MNTRKEIQFQAAEGSTKVSAILNFNLESKAVLVLAHGAGAGMQHSFMEDISKMLVHYSVAVFRFNFPYMEGTRGRPDPPNRAMKTIESAFGEVKKHLGLPIFIGGKSFGGRMASHLAAVNKMPELKGIVFFGFPLHAPGKPGIERARHLSEIKEPMLFLQGTRDALARIDLIDEVTNPIANAEVYFYEGADHSFKVLKKMGIDYDQMMDRLAKDTADWITELI